MAKSANVCLRLTAVRTNQRYTFWFGLSPQMAYQVLTFGNVAAFLLVFYLYHVFIQFQHMADPLKDAEVTSDDMKVLPLWPQGATFNVALYFSTRQKFSPVNLHDLSAKGELLLHREHLVFTNETSEGDISISLDLVSPSAKSKSKMAREGNDNGLSSERERAVVAPAIWNHLQNNKTSIFLHILLLKSKSSVTTDDDSAVPVSAMGGYTAVNTSMLTSGQVLHGSIRMLKYDKIQKSHKNRYLLSDWKEMMDSYSTALFGGSFLLSKWLVNEMGTEELVRKQLSSDSVLSYWKPEVSIRLVRDWTSWPDSHIPASIYKNIVVLPDGSSSKASRRKSKDQLYRYKPAIYVDEIGLTSDKYIPLNSSIDTLPLTLTHGGMSLQRWLIIGHLEEALAAQKDDFGFSDKDLDDVRRLISDTSVVLLIITFIASSLHLLFEFLAFQSDIQFWNDNKSLAGLSVRSVVTDSISQFVVFLYLLDSDTSLLVTIPAFAGVLIALWKVQKATGMTIILTKVAGLPIMPSLVATRLPTGAKEGGKSTSTSKDSDEQAAEKEALEEERIRKEEELTQVTLEADRVATLHLSLAVLPLVIGGSLRSLICDMHPTWYTWFIGSLTGSLYAFGFVLMTPQLYINYRLKSVSHLPWKFLVYKFINTFIDDLFAFIIKMPTMHRISVFRDDLIFFIYIYQRFVYTVDTDRPVEK